MATASMSRQPVTASADGAAACSSGRVAWMTDGYGFIEDANGDQHYFDRNSVDDPRYEDLHLGVPVAFRTLRTAGTSRALHVIAARDPSA